MKPDPPVAVAVILPFAEPASVAVAASITTTVTPAQGSAGVVGPLLLLLQALKIIAEADSNIKTA